ncbi:MAG: SET domain-containing protein-lysine N-methyltransferase, partial [Planctomycetaceae bacterium]|nr:SET domain-containing protein-lysine N-methyltransferase [Planctomycetaceae bacterium]
MPMLVLTAGEFEDRWAGTSLANSCFARGRGTMALALGYGSLSNHSFRPNARYDEVGPQTKEFTVVRDIVPGEGITVNYNGAPTSRAAVWFEVIESTASKAVNGSVPGKRRAAFAPGGQPCRGSCTGLNPHSRGPRGSVNRPARFSRSKQQDRRNAIIRPQRSSRRARSAASSRPGRRPPRRPRTQPNRVDPIRLKDPEAESGEVGDWHNGQRPSRCGNLKPDLCRWCSRFIEWLGRLTVSAPQRRLAEPALRSSSKTPIGGTGGPSPAPSPTRAGV